MMLCICSTTVNGVVLAFRKLKFEFLRSIGSLMNRRVENEITNADYLGVMTKKMMHILNFIPSLYD